MNKIASVILASFLAAGAHAQPRVAADWSQADFNDAFSSASQAAKLSAAYASTLSQAPDAEGEEHLKRAKAELEGVLRSIDALISTETDDAKKIALYKLKDQVQLSLNTVTKTLELLAAQRGGQNAKLDQTLAEAKFLNKAMSSYLGAPDFAGTIHMKTAPFELEISGEALYDAVRKKLPFLAGAVQGRLRINPGADMLAQFNALKAEYYTTLLEAAQAVKNDGRSPMDDLRLKGMAEWGRDTKVIAPGQGWQQAVEVLTFKQFNSLR